MVVSCFICVTILNQILFVIAILMNFASKIKLRMGYISAENGDSPQLFTTQPLLSSDVEGAIAFEGAISIISGDSPFLQKVFGQSPLYI